ncbi:MAG TPA: universal stress protein [Glycomyces sp.]|nr:universal stress protein [Glycomyces sp.]
MARREHEQGRIVVGVDGSPSSVAALRWALGQAELTGATVEAVNAWQPLTAWGDVIPVYPGDTPADTALEHLAAVVDEVADEHRSVEIARVVTQGHPAKVLLERAEEASLLVLGNRGHGGFVGALLGSVSQHCIHHAACPVLVVRSEERHD